MTRAVAAALGAAAIFGVPASAQTLRDFSVERTRRSEPALRAIIDFAAGELFVRPAPDGALYRMNLAYDAERYEPVGAYEAERGTVRLGVTRREERKGIPREQLPQRAVVELSPTAELTIEANLGAAETSLELGGLRVEDLSVVAGASRTEVRFSRPNPGRCRQAQVTTGAAEFRVRQLGNSGCQRWTVEGGVGQTRLDLGGAWREQGQVAVRMTVGAVTLEAPADLGIRITLDRFLTAFAPDRFTRDGRVYTSDNFATASRTVELSIETTLGNVKVEWR